MCQFCPISSLDSCHVIYCRDVAVFQRGLGDKMATFIQWVSCFVGGAILCLVRGWKLTLVLLSVAPIAAIIGAIIAVVRTIACHVTWSRSRSISNVNCIHIVFQLY